MTKDQISTYRNVLRAKVIEFHRSSMTRDHLRIEKSSDELDRMLDARERELAGQQLEANAKRLRDAQAALGRIEDGNYGICRECEETISPKRLAALPWATLCIECQGVAEANRPAAA